MKNVKVPSVMADAWCVGKLTTCCVSSCREEGPVSSPVAASFADQKMYEMPWLSK